MRNLIQKIFFTPINLIIQNVEKAVYESPVKVCEASKPDLENFMQERGPGFILIPVINEDGARFQIYISTFTAEFRVAFRNPANPKIIYAKLQQDRTHSILHVSNVHSAFSSPHSQPSTAINTG
ncbi:MAG: hypothetical protein DRN49_06300 [Thaumarchaeota archaeon]|nr:MAG: hypothetical protein DRN49_06300 [Nitrososphaerota archaeon]